MNGILRDAFVELHSRPLLEELKAEFEAMFPGLVFPDVPERVRMADRAFLSPCQHAGRTLKLMPPLPHENCCEPNVAFMASQGTLDLDSVRRSDYFFS